jgi:hypothetical protein
MARPDALEEAQLLVLGLEQRLSASELREAQAARQAVLAADQLVAFQAAERSALSPQRPSEDDEELDKWARVLTAVLRHRLEGQWIRPVDLLPMLPSTRFGTCSIDRLWEVIRRNPLRFEAVLRPADPDGDPTGWLCWHVKGLASTRQNRRR